MKTTNIFYRAMCLVLMALCSVLGVAQNSHMDPIQYYSPNTYAFARYGDLPVNYSRGLPQIDIPLMSIGDKDLNLDVSLSYHAAGIKVDQEAGWVGLGWSLNAGGVITRQVRGVPDFKSPYPSSRTSLNFYDSSYEDVTDYIEQEWHYLSMAAGNATDNAPDIFYYNFCGRAGKFYLDENRKGRMLDQEDWDIEFLSDETFRIIDERGVTYTFAATEEAQNNTFGGYYITGWYLSEISSPAGGRLTFDYVSGGTLTTSSFGRLHTSCFFKIDRSASTHSIPPTYLSPQFMSRGSVSGLVPSRITASDGSRIVFTQKDEGRLDAMQVKGSTLETVSYLNPEGRACKEYRLAYSYFEPDDSHRLELTAFNFLNYRLRLDKVSEMYPGSGNTVGSYSFSYYGDDVTTEDNVYALPYRLSPCQDHWGYYNHTDNKTIFPGNSRYESFHEDAWYWRLNPNRPGVEDLVSCEVTNGGDRNRHGEAVKACTLKKITYPTGGSTEFEFEAHDLNYISSEIGMGGLRVSRITDSDASGNVKVRTFDYESYIWDFGKCSFQSNLYHLYFDQLVYDDGKGQSAHLLAAYGVPYEHQNTDRLLMINSVPTISLGLESDFMYPAVTEHVQGQGRTEYTFRHNINYVPGDYDLDGLTAPNWGESAYVYDSSTPFVTDTYYYESLGNNISCRFPYMTAPDLGWQRGQLLERKVYSESGELMESETMTYEDRFLHVAPGYKAIGMSANTNTMNEILFACDYLASGRTRMTSRTHTLYGDNGSTSTYESYDYDENRHKLVEEIREVTSTGDTLITRYRYADSYGTTLANLKNAHILHPVDVRTYRNGKLVEGVQTQYNSAGQPAVAYRAETGGTDIAFQALNPYTFTPYAWYGYDSTTHRLNSVTLREGNEKTAYLWAYGSTYPAVRIEGADYGEVTGWLGYSMIASLKNATGAYARTLIGNIRNILAGKDVLVTTYTYLPGVGMTGMTEPGGKATSYEYDSSGRLQRIKDMDGRTTEVYQYHTVTGEEAPPEPTNTEVTFTNVNYEVRRVTAEIVCNDDCEVTFQLEGNIETSGAYVEFYLDDNYYTYSTPIDMPTTINMAAGTRFFEIYLYNTSKTTERASVTITSVNAPNTLGDNLTLSIEH